MDKPVCRVCGAKHYAAEPHVFAKEVVVHSKSLVVHKPAMVVHTSQDGSPQTTRHGKYVNMDKRRAYKREWMRAKRAI